MTDDDHTRLLRGLLAAVTDLSALRHSGQVGQVLLAAAIATVREILPSMLERCLHVPALPTVKVNRHPLGTTYSGIRLNGKATRRLWKL